MGKRILIVLTNTDKIAGTDKATGWYLPELAHPYKVLINAGLTDIDVISPKGGKAPLDPGSAEAFKDDAICQWFLKDSTAQNLVNKTLPPKNVKASDYCAVFYPGGHGPMFDLASDATIASIAAQVYDNGGVVAAVCHGPAGLLPIKLSSGDSIVKGKTVTSFTDAEEKAVGMTELMPFSLEQKLVSLGARYNEKPLFQENVVVDGKLITGQNPASSTALGEALVKLLK